MKFNYIKVIVGILLIIVTVFVFKPNFSFAACSDISANYTEYSCSDWYDYEDNRYYCSQTATNYEEQCSSSTCVSGTGCCSMNEDGACYGYQCNSTTGTCGNSLGCFTTRVGAPYDCNCTPNWPDPICDLSCGLDGYNAEDGCWSTHWCAATEDCCTPGTDWAPATDTVCLGVSFTQTESTCSTTRTATGTKIQAQTCTSSGIQFIETPQHTGSIWAKMYGVTADASYTYFPTWSSLGGQNDLQWYMGTKDVPGCTSNCTWTTTINVSTHPVTSAERWVDVDGYISGCGVTTNPCTISGFTIADKTCSVGVSATGDRSFRVTVSADGALNPGSQRARLWVERQDTSQVLNYTTEIVPATTEAHNPGAPYYYNFTSANLLSTNSTAVSTTIGVTLPSGNFYFHCDMDEDITDYLGTVNYVKCSGNPFCAYEGLGGGLTCTNWKSCGDSDRVAVCSEGETCALRCEQAKDCGGFCTGEDGVIPGVPVISSPAGTASNPTILNLGVTGVTLSLQGTAANADLYYYGVYDDGVSFAWRSSSATSVGITGLTSGNLYSWRARSENNTCEGVGVGTTTSEASNYGYFRLNSAPVIGNFRIHNFVGTTVVAENGNRNHICQSAFSGDRRVTFQLDVTDVDGVNDIGQVNLNWHGDNYTLGRGTTWSTGATYFVMVNYDTTNFPGVYAIGATAVDIHGVSTSQSTGRYWKVWDCRVPVSAGTVFDASVEGLAVCSSGIGFSAPYDGTNFTSLAYQVSGFGTTVPMVVSSPTYNSGGGWLTWGTNYLANIFNSGFDIVSPTLRIVDLGVGTTYCLGSSVISVGNTPAWPYSYNPSLMVDYAGVKIQDHWYQVEGSGIRAGLEVEANVPITCHNFAQCRAGVTVESLSIGVTNNGLVSSPTNQMSANCDDQYCYFGVPNNWFVNRSTINDNPNYNFFYEELVVKNNMGKVYGSTNLSTIVSDLGGTGIAFVNGNLTVGTTNSVALGKYLMIIVKGDIGVSSTSVNKVEGVLIADGNINVTGMVNQQTVVSGILYSSGGDINLTRGFVLGVTNNSMPAVLVKYRPDFVFSMPSVLTKVMLNWREGN